jgi:hypothetical protein
MNEGSGVKNEENWAKQEQSLGGTIRGSVIRRKSERVETIHRVSAR